MYTDIKHRPHTLGSLRRFPPHFKMLSNQYFGHTFGTQSTMIVAGFHCVSTTELWIKHLTRTPYLIWMFQYFSVYFFSLFWFRRFPRAEFPLLSSRWCERYVVVLGWIALSCYPISLYGQYFFVSYYRYLVIYLVTKPRTHICTTGILSIRLKPVPPNAI